MTQAVVVTREEIVAEARRWLDTPYQHKGRILGRAADCAAPIICTAWALGFEYEEQLDYGPVPNPDRMRAELERNMIRIPPSEAGDGDVLHLSWKQRPHHLALRTPVGILHAYNLIEPPRVVEHTLSQDWINRVRGAYRFPGVV